MMQTVRKLDDFPEYFGSLYAAQPIYLTVSSETLEALYQVMNGGTEPADRLDGKSEAWRRKAYEEAISAEMLASTWLDMEADDLLSFSLEGLGDLALCVYDAVIRERSDLSSASGGTNGYERQTAAMRQLLKNAEGSMLLDYPWLYSDIIQYDQMETETEHLDLIRAAIAHLLQHRQHSNIRDYLEMLMSETIRCDQMEEGIQILLKLLEVDPLSFSFYEGACMALLNLRRFRAASIALKGAGQVVYVTGQYSHEYEDLVVHFPAVPPQNTQDDPIPSEWERQLEEAVASFPRQIRQISMPQLAAELIPELDRIPVKQIPEFSVSVR